MEGKLKMSLLTSIKLKFIKKLEDPNYFHRFFKTQSQDEIAEAIRDLREKRGYTQSELADLSKMKQSAISRIEKPSYSKWNFQTLWRIAKPLNARWKIILEPMEDVVEEYRKKEKELNVEAKRQAIPSQSMAAFDPHVRAANNKYSGGHLVSTSSSSFQELNRPAQA